MRSTCNFQLHVGLFSKSDNQYNHTLVKENFDWTILDDGPHFSVLDFVAYLGKLDIFKFVSGTLKDKNQNLSNANSLFSSGFTPLHWASLAGRMDIVDFIVNKENIPNRNPTSDRGVTPAALATISKKIIFQRSHGGGRHCNSKILGVLNDFDVSIKLTDNHF